MDNVIEFWGLRSVYLNSIESLTIYRRDLPPNPFAGNVLISIHGIERGGRL